MCMNCTAEKWGYYIDPSDADYYLKVTAAYRKMHLFDVDIPNGTRHLESKVGDKE